MKNKGHAQTTVNILLCIFPMKTNIISWTEILVCNAYFPEI